MAGVFISYAREDLEFVKELSPRLEAASFDAWVDIEGLYAGEEFWPEVCRALDAAAAFLFVISPASVSSAYCRREIDRAVEGHKRIVPLCRQEVGPRTLHAALAGRQWVFFRAADDPTAAATSLVSALRADWVWLRQHARLLVRAREWQADRRRVLRGRELREAEEWLGQVPAEGLSPTPLQIEFVRGSRAAATRRTLRWSGAAAAALAGVLVASGFGLAQRVASLNNLSLDDLNRGVPEEAVSRLEQADRLCARFGPVLDGCHDVTLNLGRAYLDAGRYAEARERLSRAIARVENDGPVVPGEEDLLATAYQNRAFAQIMLAEESAKAAARLEGYRLAQRDFETAVGLYERTPRGAGGLATGVTMARIHLGRSEYAEAVAELERASRVSDARDIDLLFAAAYRCLGDGLRSLEHFRRYITSLPGLDRDPQWLRDRPYYERISTRCSTTDSASS